MSDNLQLAITLKAEVDQFVANVTKATSELKSNLVSMAGGADKAGSEIDAALAKLDLRRHGDIKKDIADVEAAYQKLASSGQLSLQELDQAEQKAQAQIKELRGETGNLGDTWDGMKGRLLASGVALAGVGVALAKLAGDAAQFQDRMTEVSTLLDDTSQMDRMTGAVRRLTQEFGGNHLDEARALYQIISAGATDAASATDILTAANKLAVGGVTEVKTAADGLTSVLNAYKGAAGSATDVSDAMFVAVKAGKTTIEELSGSLGLVAPLAAQAGVSFNELLAGVSTLTKSGLKSSEAITAIKQVIQALIKPTSEAVAQAQSLGLQFDAAALKTKGLAGILAEAEKATKGNTTQMGQLFGSVEALNGVLGLTGKGAKDFGDILGAMNTKAGQTDQAFAKMAESPEQAAKRFKAAMADLSISFGSALTALTPMLNGLTAVIQATNDLPTASKAGIAAIAGIGGAVVTILPSVTALVAAAKMLAPALPTAAVQAFTSTLGGLPLSLGAAAAGIGGLVAAGTVAIPIVYTLAKYLALNSQAALDAEDSQRRAKQSASDLAIAYFHLAAKSKEYRDTALLSADAVAVLAGEEKSRYRDSLDGAVKYYTAILKGLQAQQQAGVDTVNQQTKVKDKLAELEKAVKDYGTGWDQYIAKVNGVYTPAMAKAREIVEETAKSLGSGLSMALSGVTQGAVKAANDFADLASTIGEAGMKAEDVSKVLKTGLADALAKATNPKDVLLLKETLQGLGDAGYIVGKDLSDGFLAVQSRLEEVDGTAKALRETLAHLHDDAERGWQKEVEAARAYSAEQDKIAAKAQELAAAGGQGWDSLQAGAAAAKEEASGYLNQTLAIKDVFPELAAASEAARQAFADAVNAAGRAAVEAASDYSFLGDRIESVESIARRVTDEFNRQSGAVALLTARILDGTLSVEEGQRQADAAARTYNLLGQEQLLTLRQALADARQKAIALEDSARSTLNALRDEMDQLNNNQVAIENRRYATQQADLEAQLQAAQKVKDNKAVQDLRDAQRLADQIHQKKLAQINAEAAAQKAQADKAAQDALNQRKAEMLQKEGMTAPTAADIERAGGGTKTSTSSTTSSSASGSTKTVRLDFGGGISGNFDQSSADKLIALLQAKGLVTGVYN